MGHAPKTEKKFGVTFVELVVITCWDLKGPVKSVCDCLHICA